MIRFKLRAEPANFDARCRKRGLRWLRAHPHYEGRPFDYWSEFEPQLRSAFNRLCGYCAMWIPRGHVDHFCSVAALKRRRRDRLVYEWSNYRYADGFINQRKWEHEVLDPFAVQAGWFQVMLPSLQLVMTDRIPRKLRPLAEHTIMRLGLRDSEVVVRYRREWFELYQKGDLSLRGLSKRAPLVARAVEADMANGRDWRLEP